MKVSLTKKESEDFFYRSLCNINGYLGFGSEIECDIQQYKNAKEKLEKSLRKDPICYEDILMEILRSGGTLTWKDYEGHDEFTKTITLKDVHKKCTKISYLSFRKYD